MYFHLLQYQPFDDGLTLWQFNNAIEDELCVDDLPLLPGHSRAIFHGHVGVRFPEDNWISFLRYPLLNEHSNID